MTPSNVFSPQHLAFQLQVGGFLVVAIALRGLATSPEPMEQPVLVLALVAAVAAAGLWLRRRWARAGDGQTLRRALPLGMVGRRDSFPTGDGDPARRA